MRLKTAAFEISEKQIKKHFTPVYFERGFEYYENGNIINPVLRGNKLEAYCEGSTPDPYRLSVKITAAGFSGNQCSCPLGADCKHVIALLLTWVHKRDRFLDLAGVENKLSAQSKDELLDIIKGMLERNPELAYYILGSISPKKGRKTAVNPETYRAQIRNAMHYSGGWRTMGTVTDTIDSVLSVAEAFLRKNDFGNAFIVYNALIREILDDYEMVHDEGEIAMEIEAAIEGLAFCLSHNKDDAPGRLGIIKTLFEIERWDTAQGGYGLSDGIPEILCSKTTAGERILIKSWSIAALKAETSDWHKEAWGTFILALCDADEDDAGFLALAERYRLDTLLFDKLVELKDISRALDVARARLAASDWKRLQACEKLDAAGYHSEAMTLAEEGLPGCKDDRLMEWLAGKYLKGGKYGKAMELYSNIWKSGPDLDAYKNIKKTARALKNWSALKKELVQGLEAENDFELLTRIFLSEKDHAVAWGYAEKIKRDWSYPSHLILELAGASEKDFPEKSIAVYRIKAENLINARGRGNYQEACGYLKRILKIYAQTGQSPKGRELIALFRETHGNLPALRDEMNRAGLGAKL